MKKRTWKTAVLSAVAAFAVAVGAPLSLAARTDTAATPPPIGASVAVSFQPCGGTWYDGTVLVKTVTAAVGGTVNAPGAIRRPGHFLSGWYTDAGLLHKWEPAWSLTGPMTLYAGWALNYPNYSRGSGDSDYHGRTTPDTDIDRTQAQIVDPGIPLEGDAPPAAPELPLPRTGHSALKLGGLGLLTLGAGVLLSMRSRRRARHRRKK